MSDKITIREAEEKDFDGMMELNKESIDYHLNIDSYYKSSSEYEGLDDYMKEQLKDENVKILVAEGGGEIIGRIVGVIIKPSPYARPERIGNIDEAYIKEKYRRMGIGKELFDRLLKWFKERGIKRLELSVDARNEIGVNAWRKFGFSDYRLNMKRDL